MKIKLNVEYFAILLTLRYIYEHECVLQIDCAIYSTLCSLHTFGSGANARVEMRLVLVCIGYCMFSERYRPWSVPYCDHLAHS